MQKLVFESYNINHIEDKLNNPIYTGNPLGFANQLRSIRGYDPMHLSAVFAGVQRISNALGSMPWEIKAYDESDISKSHWFNSLFDTCLQTQFLFTKNIIKDVITQGNGYALIHRNGDKPVGLTYLPAGTCSPQINLTNNTVEYHVSFNGRMIGKYKASDVIHVFVNSVDGWSGISLFNYADKSIKLSAYTEKAALDYYGSGLRYIGILSTDAPKISPKQREELRQSYLSGINSENGIAILEQGMKFSPMSNSAKDAELIDTRQYNVQEMARWLTMAPTILGDFSHNIYGTIEAGSIDFITNCCGPYVTAFEQELNRKLLTPQERKKFYISLNEEVLIKSDRTTYASYISTLLDKGVISINEARKMINMHEIEDGDVYILPYQGQKDSNGNIIPSYNNSNQGNNQNTDKNIDTKPDEKSTDN